jgi:hypothetical protein
MGKIAPTMSALDIMNEFEKHAFSLLKRDGLFVNATLVRENELLLETTTYITDTDEGRDIDCLVVHDEHPWQDGGCVCENITTGELASQNSEPPRGCVACPVCQRLARPWKLQVRRYCLLVRINEDHLSPLNSQPNANLKVMPNPMSEKIIGLCNTLFPAWTHG